MCHAYELCCSVLKSTTMAGEVILADLKSGVLEDIPGEVEDYLGPVFHRKDGLSTTELRSYGMFCVRYLYTCVSELDSTDEVRMAALVQGSVTCLECVKLTWEHIELKEPLTLQKVVYHIFGKLVKQGCLGWSLQISKYLHHTLELAVSEGEGNISAIANNVYASLWNTAIKQDQQVSSSDQLLILQLRQQALLFLALHNKDPSVIIDRTTTALARLRASQKSPRLLEAGVDMYRTMEEVILKNAQESSNHDTDIFIKALLDLSTSNILLLIRSKAYTEIQPVVDKLTTSLKILSQNSKQTACYYNTLVTLIKLTSSLATIASQTDISPSKAKQCLERCMVYLKDSGVLKSVRDLCESDPWIETWTDILHVVRGQIDHCLKQKCTVIVQFNLGLCDLMDVYTALLRTQQKHLSQTLNTSKDQTILKKLQTAVSRQLESQNTYLQLLYETLREKESLLDNQEVLQVIYEKLELMEKFIMESSAQPKLGVTVREFYYLGSLAYRFACLCYKHPDLVSMSSQFFKVACKACSVWCKSEPELTVTRVKETSLWNRYDYLVDTQRQRGCLHDAMETILESLLVDTSHMTNAAELWAKIKRDFVKQESGGNCKLSTKSGKDLTGRVLLIDLQKKGGAFPESTAIALLECELRAYRYVRAKNTADQHAVVKVLLKICKNPVRQAEALIQQAQILREDPSLEKREPSVCLKQAVDLLEPCVGKKKHNQVHVKDALARANLWLFICQSDNITPENTHVSEELESRGCSSTLEEDSCTLTGPVLTVNMEYGCLETLDCALRLWTEVGNCSLESLRDWKVTVDSLNMVALTYKVTNKPLFELQALLMMSTLVSQNNQDPRYLQTNAALLLAYTNLSLLDKATLQIQTVDRCLESLQKEGSTVCKVYGDHVYVQYLIAKSHVLLMTENVQDAVKLINQASVVTATKDRTKDWCLYDGIIKRYLSKIAALPSSITMATTDDYALDRAHEGIRLHMGVCNFVIGSDKSTETILYRDKWEVIDQYLLTLYHIGLLYKDIGETREAKCYLKEGLTLAQKFNLPRRLGEFLLSLSSLDNLSGSVDEAMAKLNNTNFVLNSEMETAHKIRKPSKRNSAICFGFDSSGEEEDFLVSKPVNIEDHSSQCESDPEDPLASPALRTQKITLPSYAEHSKACTCSSCSDLGLHQLNITYLTSRAECYRLQGAFSQSMKILEMNVKFVDVCKIKTQKVLASVGIVVNGSNTQNKNLKKGTKQKDACQVYEDQELLLFTPYSAHIAYQAAEVKLTEGLLEQACATASKALQEMGPHCGLSYSVATHLNSICGIAGVWSKYVKMEDTVVSDLNTKLAKMELDEDVAMETEGDKENAEIGKSKTNKVKGQNARKKASLNGILVENKMEKLNKSIESGNQLPNAGNPVSFVDSANYNGESTKAITAAYKTPARKIRNRKSITVDNQERTNPQLIVTSFKTPARKMRPKKVVIYQENNDSDDEPETETPHKNRDNAFKTPGKGGNNMLKTPHSVSSRRAVLDILIDSDSDDELEQEQATRRGNKGGSKGVKEARQKGTRKTSAVGKRNKSGNDHGEKELSNNDILKSVDVNSPNVTKVRNGTRSKIPVFKGTPTLEENDVYNFDSPSLTKAQRRGQAAKNSGKTKSKNSKKDTDDNYGDIENCPVIEPRPKRRGRMTRSKVDVVEKRRSGDEFSEDSLLMSSPGSVVLTDGDSDSSLIIKPGPDAHTSQKYMDLREERTGEVNDLVSMDAHIYQEVELNLDSSLEMARGDSDGETVSRKGRGRKVKKGKKNSAVIEEPELPRASEEQGKCNRKGGPRFQPENAVVNDLGHHLRQLHSAFNHIKAFPPAVVYRHICHALALQCLDDSQIEAAYYLTEGAAVTFRHSMLANTGKKMRKLLKESPSNSTEKSQLEEIQSILAFNKTPGDVVGMCDQLPEGLTVCQLTVVSVGNTQELVVSRFRKGLQPIVLRLAGFATNGCSILEEFSVLMTESKQSMTLTEKVAWWTQRRDLNERMKDMLDDLEDKCLGQWRGVMLGCHSNKKDAEKLTKCVLAVQEMCKLTDGSVRQLIQILIDSSSQLATSQLSSAVQDICKQSGSQAELCEDIVKAIRRFSKQLNTEVVNREPVVLVLDKVLQHLPWESIPILRHHNVSRVPSLYYLQAQLNGIKSDPQSILNLGVDPKQTYYILNPDQNLPNTQKQFEDWFKSESGWTGVVEKIPSSDQYKEALTQHNLFIYCGHGNGSKYFQGDNIKNLKCQAATLLMGCSSGKLTVKGSLEASGMMLDYFMAGCPCIVANLWDVTDRDIDRFLEELLKSWLPSKTGSSLAEYIAKARDTCKLPFLIGASPVIYGLPVRMK